MRIAHSLILLFILVTFVGGCKKTVNDTNADRSIEHSQIFKNTDTQRVEHLIWPIDCIPGSSCGSIMFPDTDKDGKTHDCGSANYIGHEGTDIVISNEQVDQGIAVRAASDGKVLWVFDGKYDRCPSDDPDCQPPSDGFAVPGKSSGYRVCTELGPYCKDGKGECFWCFDGGNVVVIRHLNVPGLFATRYDHLKKNSISVSPGDMVKAGQKIGEVGSAGHSSTPHLHFEVWGNTYYDPVDPWVGSCGPNQTMTLWEFNPPWKLGPYSYTN